jgi:hypothetical protein
MGNFENFWELNIAYVPVMFHLKDPLVKGTSWSCILPMSRCFSKCGTTYRVPVPRSIRSGNLAAKFLTRETLILPVQDVLSYHVLNSISKIFGRLLSLKYSYNLLLYMSILSKNIQHINNKSMSLELYIYNKSYALV